MEPNGDLRRVLLWIAASLFFIIFITSIWYWFYLHYYQQGSPSPSLPRTNEHHGQQTQPGATQPQNYLGPVTRSDYESYELETVHKSPRPKAGGGMGITAPIAVPPRLPAHNDRSHNHTDQVPTTMTPELVKEDLFECYKRLRYQHAVELAKDVRRYDSVTGSDSSGSPQMTPQTGSSAAQTPEGQRTPLPRYRLEPCGTDAPGYTESEPSGHAARASPRRPTF